MTILQALVYQMHVHLMACHKACILYTNTSLPVFLVQSRLLKLIIATQLSLVNLLQKYDPKYETVKTYSISIIMNQNCVLKTTMSTVNSLHVRWNLDNF